MWFNRPTTNRNYSGEQKVSFESPVPFSKCLRAKIYCNIYVHFDPQGCQTLLLKESEPFFLSLGSWTMEKNLKIPLTYPYNPFSSGAMTLLYQEEEDFPE